MNKIELLRKDLLSIQKELDNSEVIFTKEEEQLKFFINHITRETKKSKTENDLRELEEQWDSLEEDCVSSNLRNKMNTLFFGSARSKPEHNWQNCNLGEVCFAFRKEGNIPDNEQIKVNSAIEKAREMLKKNKK